MKICLISLAKRGGMVHYLSELASSLAINKSISIIVPKSLDRDLFFPGLDTLGINLGTTQLDTFTYLFRPSTYLAIYRALKKANADIYHITAPQEWNPILTIIIRALIRKPVVLTVHDPKPHQGEKIYHRILNAVTRFFSNYFITHSSSGKIDLETFGIPHSKIKIIPIGVFKHFLKYYRKDIKEENIILFFGRIEPYKGLDILLDIAPSTLEKLPTFKIIVAGSGSLAPYKNQLPIDGVEIHNRYISDDEVSELFQRAKIVVLPYKNATQSGVVQVAFAFNKPVIATNTGSISEVVIDNKTGILVPPNNATKFQEAIIKLACNEGFRNKLKYQIKKYAAAELNWSKIAEATVTWYQEILNTR